MGWTVSYELRRKARLTREERAWLEQHAARRKYDLRVAPESGVLASGWEKVPFDTEHDDWRNLLVAITELRQRFANAECDVSDTYECIYWDEELEAYANGDRDGAEVEYGGGGPADDEEVDDEAEEVDEDERDELGDTDGDRGFLKPELEDVPAGRLRLAHEPIAGPISTTLEATLEGRDLAVQVGLTKAAARLQVRNILFVARTADGAPCFSKVLASPSGDRLYVPAGFADIVSSFELFADVEYEVDELIASYDAKATIATKGFEPIQLDPRVVPRGIGLEVVSLAGGTVSEFGDQEIALFPRVKALDALTYGLMIVCKLVDGAGKQLATADGMLRQPIDLVRARSSQPASVVEAVRRIDVFAKGRVEGQLALGRFRVANPAT